MLKRIAILVSLVMVFSLSFVFATSEAQDTLLIAPNPGNAIEDTANSDEEVVSRRYCRSSW